MIDVAPFAATAGLLFGAGLYALLTRTGLIRRLLGINIMASAVFLFLVVLSTRAGGESADPVPQAMVLTGIVISVSLTAFALGLIRHLRTTTGSAVLPRSERNTDGPSGDD